jgi:hypothetical protein
VLTCLQDSWPGIVMKGFDLIFELWFSVLIRSYIRAIVGGSSVNTLLCKPNGPGSIQGMSRSETAITRGNPLMRTHTLLCTTFSQY